MGCLDPVMGLSHVAGPNGDLYVCACVCAHMCVYACTHVCVGTGAPWKLVPLLCP